MRDRWVLDRLLRAGGIDVLWPDVTGILLEMGFKYPDIDRAMGRSRSLAEMPKQWLRLADHHFASARDALDRGHPATASERFYRACGCYARARWGSLTRAQRNEVYGRLLEAYSLGREAGNWQVQRVSIPIGEGTIPGLLHLPSGVTEPPWPAVVVYPGMDMTKEYFPVPYRNIFTERGIAALVIDPPGQGENEASGPLLTAENAEAAGAASVDLLQARSDIDATSIGAFGIGTNTYTVFSFAASEDRLGCVVGFEGAHLYQRSRFVDEAQPAFEARMKRMTGLDGEPFRTFLDAMTLEGRESDIRAPALLMVGEWDEHVPLSELREFFSRLDVPKKMVVYEGENHVMGRVSPEALQDAADWVADVLTAGPSTSWATEEFVPEY